MASRPVRNTRRRNVPAAIAVILGCVLATPAPAAGRLSLHGPFALGAGPLVSAEKGGVLSLAYVPRPFPLGVASGPDSRLLVTWMGRAAPVEAASGSPAGFQAAQPAAGAGAGETTEVQTAFGPDGALLVGWRSVMPDGIGNGSAAVAGMEPGAAGWRPGPSLADASGDAAPVVAFDPRGDGYAVWLSGTLPEAVEASVRPAGGAWRAPVRISAATRWSAGHLSVGVGASGEAIAIWEATEPGTERSEIEAAVYSPARGWRRQVSLGGGNDPVVAVRAGRQALAAWHEYGEGPVVAATIDLHRGRRISSRVLPGSQGPKGPLSIAVGPAGADVVWWKGEGEEFTEAPEPPVRLIAAINVTRRSTRARTVAAWRYRRTFTRQFEDPMCDPTRTASASFGFDRQGTLTAAWTQGCGAVFVQRRRARASRWGARIAAGPLLGDGVQPLLAVDDRGEVAAAWLSQVAVPGAGTCALEGAAGACRFATDVLAAVLAPG
ncbi:MAG TPA: hypothetical protein VHT27_01480 [Solirubrobacteraceae bacterium]|jgi:hypothetical protein|nr:hypothetical protein [Solirubrobacteraceae bacterium]